MPEPIALDRLPDLLRPGMTVFIAGASGDAALVFIEIGTVALVLSVLARLSARVGITAIPLYLLAGLTVGEGGIAPLDVSADFIELAGEIGVLLALFALSLAGQIAAGWLDYNGTAVRHAEPAVTLLAYLGTGHFLEALFENWESEFLQMGTYVVLTAYLYQRGSPESRRLDAREPQDENPAVHAGHPGAPWPVRRGATRRDRRRTRHRPRRHRIGGAEGRVTRCAGPRCRSAPAPDGRSPPDGGGS